MQASSTRRVTVTGSPAVRRLAGGEEAGGDGLVVELHVPRLEADEVLDDVGDVVLVDEVGAVAAAALLHRRCIGVEHPLAPGAVDAVVARPQERRVEHPRALLVGVVERHPLAHLEPLHTPDRTTDGCLGDGTDP